MGYVTRILWEDRYSLGGWVAFGRLLVGRLVVSQFIDSNAIVYIWYINFV